MSDETRRGAVVLLRRLKRLSRRRVGLVGLAEALLEGRGPGLPSLAVAFAALNGARYYKHERRKAARLAAIDRAIKSLEAP